MTPSRVHLLPSGAARDARGAENVLRTAARQQEAVAHLGQQALAGAPVLALLETAAGLVARGLEVEFSEILEYHPERRSLTLRTGSGWPEGRADRVVLSADAGALGGYVLNAPGPVVIEDAPRETRFEVPRAFRDHGVASGIAVVIDGKQRPFGILGVHTTRPREFTTPEVLFLQAVAHVLGTSIERALAEDALRRSEGLFRSLIENASDIVTVLTDDGILRYVSPSVERLLGYGAAELLGRSAFEFMHADDLAAVLEAMRNAIGRPGTTQAARFRFRHKDGSWRVLESIGQARRDRTDAYSIIVNSRDITERERQEQVLRASKERLRLLVRHAPYGIYRVTPEGRFLAANPALVEMLGCESEAQLLDHTLATALYVDPGERADYIARLREGPRAVSAEVTWRRPDGERIRVRLNGRAVHGADGRVEFEVFAENVTERRALEDQLRQSQKMEALGQLTGGIAHDFNNLLTVVLANAELLQRALPADGDGQPEVQDIVSAALSGRIMVNQLLGFARRSPLNLETMHLGHAVRDLARVLRRVLPADIEVVVLADEDLPDIQADAHAVEQILFNLVNNARDAMPEGGVLRIETSCTWLTEEQRRLLDPAAGREYVCLAVDDTGAGMDEVTRQRVFEPFFTTKPAGQGTGLGMATVYGLVRQHGGLVQIDSAPAMGTRVRVYFPVAEERAAAPAAETPAEAVRGGDETVLVVEDQTQLRRATTRTLEGAGYTVITAGDGEEALQRLRTAAAPIHLVLTDLVMPRLGGQALHDAARREGMAVPFLFASGGAGPDGRPHEALDPGLPFIGKPWNSVDLLKRVRELLDRPAPLAPSARAPRA